LFGEGVAAILADEEIIFFCLIGAGDSNFNSTCRGFEIKIF
jgi:hypothetical protein